MSSKTYIICWDKSLENCLDIHSQLSSTDIDYTIYNVSSSDIEMQNWQTAPDTRYYSHFHRALQDFVSTDHTVFIFNAGDVEYPSYALYTKNIEYFFNKDPEIGAFAPNMTHDVFSGQGSSITDSVLHPGLTLSTHTNGIYTSLSRDVAEFMLDYMDWAEKNSLTDWKSIVSGWGLDTAYCAISVLWGKKIYRDSSVLMYHQEGTSYGEQKAIDEMSFVMDSFKKFCLYKGIDPEKIQRIFDITYDKVRTKKPLSISDLYDKEVSA